MTDATASSARTRCVASDALPTANTSRSEMVVSLEASINGTDDAPGRKIHGQLIVAVPECFTRRY
jgi:hypothetical protein